MKRKWNLKGFKFHSSIHCKFNSCIFTAASTIRAQVRNIDCKMPWLLQAADLETENTESGEYLSMFLNSLLSGKVSIHLSKCLNRPRLAIDQNLYAISNRTLPKSVHFPHMIETLSNCKQLINITNWLGHGMSDILKKWRLKMHPKCWVKWKRTVYYHQNAKSESLQWWLLLT